MLLDGRPECRVSKRDHVGGLHSAMNAAAVL
jgi:hypothetical protein